MKKLNYVALSVLLFLTLVISGCSGKTVSSIILQQTDNGQIPQNSGTFVVKDGQLTIKKQYGKLIKSSSSPEDISDFNDEEKELVKQDMEKNGFESEKDMVETPMESTFEKVKVTETDKEITITASDKTWTFKKESDRIAKDENNVRYEILK
ncbi:hypothetical protein [Atopobacter phocae]|uniref:hypothetical protein n=1 Tax=Atopobacter phocae TaxID=136492 RepID=UPI00046E7E63|nr:hypothetical protein [Atopobacter phocae]